LFFSHLIPCAARADLELATRVLGLQACAAVPGHGGVASDSDPRQRRGRPPYSTVFCDVLLPLLPASRDLPRFLQIDLGPQQGSRGAT
jgi:hypothetical protein